MTHILDALAPWAAAAVACAVGGFILVKGCEMAVVCQNNVRVLSPNDRASCDRGAIVRTEQIDGVRLVYCECPPEKE